MIQLIAAFGLAAIIGGLIIWWAYRELAHGIKDI